MKKKIMKIYLIVMVIAILVVIGTIFYYLVNQDNIIYAKIGEATKIGDYEVIIMGLVFEDGAKIHKERLEYFEKIGWSISANYYKNTYKIIIPFISIKNLDKTDTLRFDPKDFSLLTKSGHRYKHIQRSGYYEGETLIGGEIKSGYISSGWYGFELPKGYNEGNKIFIEMVFPNTQKVLVVETILPY